MEPAGQGSELRCIRPGTAIAVLVALLGIWPAAAWSAPGMAVCQARYAAIAANNRRIIAKGMDAYRQTIRDKRGEAQWTPEEKAAIAAMEPLLESRKLPADETDLKIVERANAKLIRPAVWNRHDTRDCPRGAATLSLYCALHDASIELTGKYDHRRTGLQEVRFAIQDAVGHDLDHRMMDYNNMATTSFGDIKMILHSAEARLRERLDKQAHCDL